MKTLSVLGLVRHDPVADHHVGLSPDALLHPQLTRAQYELLARQAELDGQRHDLLKLTEMFQEGLRRSPSGVDIERIEGPRMPQRMQEIFASGSNETLVIYRELHRDVEETRLADLAALAAGMRIRSIFPTSLRQSPEHLASALDTTAHGEEYRLLARPPVTFVALDGSTVLIPIAPEDPQRGAVAIRTAAVVRVFILLFEALFDLAEPLLPAQAASVDLSEREHQVLQLLAAGSPDEAIARALRVSVRTIRRDIELMLDRLRVRTRFQIGAEAVRRGWL